MAVVIPACNEPGLDATLSSLLAGAPPPDGTAEVFVVVNDAASADLSEQRLNSRALEFVRAIESKTRDSRVQVFAVDARGLPDRYAGVGTARKIGMDIAAERLIAATSGGIIVNLDADCTVSTNYLQSISAFFADPAMLGSSLYFEHPLSGDPTGDAAIIQYELFLRYYVNALRWCGHPYAFQTVGSAMAVRAETYREEGGMNRRKAAEDFYFLQKIIARHGYGDLNETCVFPSGRASSRVPFGTGRTVLDWQKRGSTFLPAYHPQCFVELRALISRLPELATEPPDAPTATADLGPAMTAFLRQGGFAEKLAELRVNTASPAAFRARFFRWFNLFRCRQFMHFARDRFYLSLPVSEAAAALFPDLRGLDPLRQLLALRQADRIRPAKLTKDRIGN